MPTPSTKPTGLRCPQLAIRWDWSLTVFTNTNETASKSPAFAYFWNVSDVSKYILKLSSLKVDRSHGAPAPHKAILLISVLQFLLEGRLRDNRISITPELVARFKDNWRALVEGDRFTPNFSLPFYHLRSEGFWHLKTLPGSAVPTTSSHSVKSLVALKNAVAYASLDEPLFRAAAQPQTCRLLISALLQTYFDDRTLNYTGQNAMTEAEQKVLYEPPSKIKTEKIGEEEAFIRSGAFKKQVPLVYNYTCCISGMAITATRDVQMVDACHIVPFAETHLDHITNGLSLSPNLHRAFDRFLITIDEDYKVVVSNSFTESEHYSIRRFHGQPILLPGDPRFYPAIENLQWHHKKFGQLQ